MKTPFALDDFIPNENIVDGRVAEDLDAIRSTSDAIIRRSFGFPSAKRPRIKDDTIVERLFL